MSSAIPTVGLDAVGEMDVRGGRVPEPCVIVIFGATGDLTKRELVPSLFELYGKDLLPEEFAIVGTASSDLSTEEFRERMHTAAGQYCSGDLSGWESFAEKLSYVPVDATSESGEGFAALTEAIKQARSKADIPDNILFHLAVPPALFPVIASGLGAAGLARTGSGWRRLIVEKPFGSDRESGRALDDQLREVFGEEQIYRVDHFLGKETVQNMLVFRFANPGFEPVWNRNYIDHVQITVAEKIGIGTRAKFYEETGVVRDMIQNHLLQLLCMVAMEPPHSFDARSLRDETVKVLEAINLVPMDVERDAVRGQYDSGEIDGEQVAGYREEDGVDPDSHVSTYAALKLTLDNWRWAGVPFYLRTGKRMTRGITEVAIHFKPTPHFMFASNGRNPRHRSVVVFEVQPNEGIEQTFAAKQPGPDLVLRTVSMKFDYADAFGIDQPPRAYAWLLLDAMQGDQTLFARADWVDAAWRIVDPIVEQWTEQRPDGFPNYKAGTAGPAEADELLRRDGREWRAL